ncbi:MAG: hypothetical protein ACYDEB_01555 [Dehalococcoidia bacterium]
MKHATSIALDGLEPLLRELRALDGLTERTRGVFYRRSSAFLHFHEDPAGFFADVRIGPGWARLPATTAAERRALLREVKAVLRAG